MLNINVAFYFRVRGKCASLNCAVLHTFTVCGFSLHSLLCTVIVNICVYISYKVDNFYASSDSHWQGLLYLSSHGWQCWQ